MANEYGNYCTLNALSPNLSNKTLSNGNLSIASTNASAPYSVRGTIAAPNSGRWKMFEFTNKGNYSIAVGIIDVSLSDDGNDVSNAGGSYGYYNNGQKYVNGTGSSYGDAFNSDGKIITCIIDYDAATVEFFLDNSSQGTIAINATVNYVPFWWNATSGGNGIFNFGATNFDYSNSSYLPINTANLPTPAIINPDDHFHSVVVAHDGSSTASTCTFNLSTYEWLAIIKNTTGADENWYWINSIRGVNKYTSSNTSASEVTDANVLTVSGTTFTLGSTLGAKNYLVEIHKAGLASATASNEAGSINTTETSFNQLSGFVISEFEGTAGNATIGNPLDEALDFLIHRPLDISGIANNAVVYHSSLSSGTQFITMGEAGDGATIVAARETGAPQQTEATIWNSTAPTSSLISMGSSVRSNAGSSMISYGWHEVSGYSAFGSYVHNGNADGPFINTGSFFGSFLTRHITDSGATGSSSWTVMDRNLGAGVAPGYNKNFPVLAISTSAIAPTSGNGIISYDFPSNGMKIRRANAASGSVWMYCSWGGTPIQGDGAVNQGRAK